MKKVEIKIRINEKLKGDFKKICENENTTMSNKIHEFIYNKVEEEKTKPIRVSLVKSICEKIFTEHLFDELNSIKPLLEKELNNMLNFETKVSEIQNNSSVTFGSVYFKLNDDDEKPYVLDFSIVSNDVNIIKNEN